MQREAQHLMTRPGNSLAKAIDVLRAFIDGQDAWGVRELANALDRPSSSVHRILKVFRQEGLLEWDAESQHYRVGMEFHRWGAVLSAQVPLAKVAAPILSELTMAVGESCWLGVYERTHHRHSYIIDAPGPHALRHHAPIGRNDFLWQSAGGLAVFASLTSSEQNEIIHDASERLPETEFKALTETLTSIRVRGYAQHSPQQADLPVTIAAAVFDSLDRPIGSLSLAVPRHRYDHGHQRELGSNVAVHARKLSHLLGSRLLGGAGAGSWHVGSEWIADLIREHVPGIHPYRVAGGGDLVIRDLHEGKGAYGLAVAGSLSAAWRGEHPFNHPHDRLRAVCSLFPLYLHIIAHPRHQVRHFADVVRHRVSAGQSGYTTAAVFRQLLEIAGQSDRSFKMSGGSLLELDYAEANREFAAHEIDITISLAGLGDPALLALARAVGIDLVALDEEILDAFLAANSRYEKTLIPAGVYFPTQKAIKTISSTTILLTTVERSESEVFHVAKTLFERREELAASSAVFRNFGPDTIFRGIDVPIHPGAARYWQECGIC